MKELRGKKALLTGAASGIGRALARALAAEGVDLCLLDVNEAGLVEVVAEVRARGVEAHDLRCDLAVPTQISAAVQEVLRRWGHVDLLLNNAGIAYYGPTERMTAEQWDRVMAINLLAPIQLTRELLPILLARPEAHVLNVCSIAGLVAGSRLAAYHASKYGLVGFSEALRAEYRRHGLGVTALCPGLVRTNIYQTALTGRDKPVKTPPAWLCATPEAIAARAVRAIRRDRGLVLVTAMAHFLWLLKRFSPSLLAFLAGLARKGKRCAPEAAPLAAPADRAA